MQDRRKAAAMGALVADAATMGLHWIYNTQELASLVKSAGRAETPEFFEPPSCPFYKLPSGDLSTYGNEALGLLKYLAGNKSFDAESFSKHLAGFYKSYSGYLNHSSKTLVSNIESGSQWPNCGDKNDSQANCIVKVPFIVAKYAGSQELDQIVVDAIRVQQDNNVATEYGLAAAKILERVIQGSNIFDALSWAQSSGNIASDVQEKIKVALAESSRPYIDVVKKLGSSCAMPSAIQNVFVCASTAESYTAAVRINMLAGGDNCSRSVYLGALLAAQFGVESIPLAWRKKVKDWQNLQLLCEEIVSDSTK